MFRSERKAGVFKRCGNRTNHLVAKSQVCIRLVHLFRRMQDLLRKVLKKHLELLENEQVLRQKASRKPLSHPQPVKSTNPFPPIRFGLARSTTPLTLWHIQVQTWDLDTWAHSRAQAAKLPTWPCSDEARSPSPRCPVKRLRCPVGMARGSSHKVPMDRMGPDVPFLRMDHSAAEPTCASLHCHRIADIRG